MPFAPPFALTEVNVIVPLPVLMLMAVPGVVVTFLAVTLIPVTLVPVMAPDVPVLMSIPSTAASSLPLTLHRPDVTLMDLHLPCMTGVEAVIAIRTEFPDALILVMATEMSDGQIQRALAAGARGCLHKGMPMTEVLATIRQAHANRDRRGIPRGY